MHKCRVCRSSYMGSYITCHSANSIHLGRLLCEPGNYNLVQNDMRQSATLNTPSCYEARRAAREYAVQGLA